jgi:hypothetical protein
MKGLTLKKKHDPLLWREIVEGHEFNCWVSLWVLVCKGYGKVEEEWVLVCKGYGKVEEEWVLVC